MRYRRIISAVLVPVMLVQFTACTKWTWVGPAKLRPEEGKVKAVESVPQVAGQNESPAREGGALSPGR
jgi:hypothetical protein